MGLAGTGGRMQQAAVAGLHGRPELALESEGLPALDLEPGICGMVCSTHRLIVVAAAIIPSRRPGRSCPLHTADASDEKTG